MIEELVGKVFALRSVAHAEHWKTKSGYVHETLGAVYDGLISGIDSFVEPYIGNFGTLGPITTTTSTSDTLTGLKDLVAWIEENRDELTGEVCALEARLDDFSADILGWIFKLDNLS